MLTVHSVIGVYLRQMPKIGLERDALGVTGGLYNEI